MKEEKVERPSIGKEAQRMRRTPVAISDGSKRVTLNDNANGRRRRVRISLSESKDETQARSQHPRGTYTQERQAYYPGTSSAVVNMNEATGRREGSGRARGHKTHCSYSESSGRTEQRPRSARPSAHARPNTTRGSFDHSKTKKSRAPMPTPEPVSYKAEIGPDESLRLNKYLANSGLCSRREADEYIISGKVSVNGSVVTELGSRVTLQDRVEVEGKPITFGNKVYVLLNKPKNCVTTMSDPEGRLTVMDLVKQASGERIFPVGRLDRHTTGVLLLTNDGDLTSKLTHPKYEKKKIYHVWLDKPVPAEHMQAIAEGIELEDGEIHADAISYVTEEDLSQVGIEIHSGRNRIVRRIFEHFGYRVVKLDRVYFAGLTKKDLPRGRWRYLNEQEVINLRMGAFD